MPPAGAGAEQIRAGLMRSVILVVMVGAFTGSLALLLLVRNDVDLSVYCIAFFAAADAWPVVVGNLRGAGQ